MPDIEVSENINKLLSLPQQINFAAATSLTAVAQEVQEACLEAIEETFIIRSPWAAPSSATGIHVTAATKDNLTAEVSTPAWWLIPHETGEDKTPADGDFLAVPTENARPNVRQIIPRSRRPGTLRNAFVRNTRRGLVLFERQGQRIVPMYGLERSVRIRRRSTIVEPTIETVEDRFGYIFAEKLAQAIKTAR